MKGDIGSFVESAERTGGVLARPRPGSPNNTAEELRRASLFVASEAEDAEDCALLLDMLGLLPPAAARQAS